MTVACWSFGSVLELLRQPVPHFQQVSLRTELLSVEANSIRNLHHFEEFPHCSVPVLPGDIQGISVPPFVPTVPADDLMLQTFLPSTHLPILMLLLQWWVWVNRQLPQCCPQHNPSVKDGQILNREQNPRIIGFYHISRECLRRCNDW